MDHKNLPGLCCYHTGSRTCFSSHAAIFFSRSLAIHPPCTRFGQQAEAALENARETLAKGLNCQPKEVIFTSCGSESDNLALRGAAFAARRTP